ncbi:SAM-dependent methyltransferase [Aeromicrobium sp.]|uniref:SAM-dependent methyltransferase n=1 Tax=Aeromicrobium sp. TaxID=1871063 RepID=UPI00198340A5|nr:SAM-dependent methyltransferase [Aeromicrobium sp.]MBC7631431.1 SAM-dependent methyltransferase [Aeromicrobium sp.]
MTTEPRPWRRAWHDALYGENGFFRVSTPANHFSTSAHLGAFAGAVAEIVHRNGFASVVDLGAGGGEMLAALRPLVGADIELIGVELARRPPGLDPDIGWCEEMPQRIDGLLMANEWLDNIPCDIVEVDDAGVVRLLLVDATTGKESLGKPYRSAWLDEWWPLTRPGERAEVGDARDVAWADAVARVEGLAIAIDYGHTRTGGRPPLGTLRSYADGHEVDVVPDGSRDVTAHVAVDSVASATGSGILRQRDALAVLGIDGHRPPLDLARTEPADYLRALSVAGEAGELLARGGLGDFWWLVSDPRGRGTLEA